MQSYAADIRKINRHYRERINFFEHKFLRFKYKVFSLRLINQTRKKASKNRGTVRWFETEKEVACASNFATLIFAIPPFSYRFL